MKIYARADMTEVSERLIEIIASPKDKRQVANVENVIPWIKRRVRTLHNVDYSGLVEIIKSSKLARVSKDDVIVQQGAQTDSMFIILRGSTLVYIDTTFTAEEGTQLSAPADQTLSSQDRTGQAGKLRRNKISERTNIGKYITRYYKGDGFGQVALLSKDGTMNCTVVAEEDCDLMVIHRGLFDTFLKSDQQNEYDELCHFIESHAYFTSLAPKFKRFLELCLRKETFLYNSTITHQGQAVTVIHFLVKGQANMYIEPNAYKKQYIKLWPFEASIDLYCQEFEYLRKSRKKAILRKYKDPTNLALKSDHLVARRNEGYAAAEKIVQERSVCLCTVQGGEILGELEVIQNLGTYLSTVTCTTPTTVFVLEVRNLERLVSKRNQKVVEIMKEKIKEKLQRRVNSNLGRDITFLNYLLFKITEDSYLLPDNKKLPAIKSSKFLPGKDVQIQHLLEKFKDGQAQLIEPRVPGALIYKEQMQEKARTRARYRYRGMSEISFKLRETRQKVATRQPRSRREIVNFLKESLESQRKEYVRMCKDASKLKNSRTYNQNEPTKSVNDPQHNDLHLEEDISENELLKNLMNLKDTNKEDTKQNYDVSIITKDEERSFPDTEKSISKNETNDSQYPETKNVLHSLTVTTTDENPEIVGPSSKLVAEKVSNVDEDKKKCVKIVQFEDEDQSLLNSSTLNLECQKLEVPAVSKSLLKLAPLEKNCLKHTEKRLPSRWESTKKFVNTRISDLFSYKLLYHRSVFDDYETSDNNLMLLENRIRTFFAQSMNSSHFIVPKLRRFNAEQENTLAGQPKPGGKVWVRKRLCRYANTSVKLSDHEHVRHHIVPELPQFRNVEKTRAILHHIFSGPVHGN